jgi:SAM-dependent methyltransferase
MIQTNPYEYLKVINAYAEDLPIADASYDVVLTVTLDCFLKDVQQAYREISRILKPDSYLIVAFLDRASPLGAIYEAKKENSPFYAAAQFHSAEEIKKQLNQAGFQIVETRQTVFSLENQLQDSQSGSGEGVFVVFKAIKKPTPT